MFTNAYILYKQNTSDNIKLAFTQKDHVKHHMMQRNQNQDNR